MENKETTKAIDFLKWLRTKKFYYRGTQWMKDKNTTERFTDEELCEIFIKEHKVKS